jgi:hypothetical protein
MRMAIEPDSKDWTWVLDEPCTECGFDANALDARAVAGRLRAAIPRWIAVLLRPDARTRPDASTWSPAEYACHVRDVLAVFRDRVELMLDADDPEFANWDQDEAARADEYAAQVPVRVGPVLRARGLRMAQLLESVPSDAWSRTGRRSNGSTFTIETLVLYLWHDITHHLHDIDA